MKNSASLIISLMLFGTSSLIHAEVLNMPLAAEPEPVEAEEAMTPPSDETMPQADEPTPVMESAPTTLPGRGMSMEQVTERFGTPKEKVEQVGEPPITRWVFGTFTVYFEHDKVIHAVTHKN